MKNRLTFTAAIILACCAVSFAQDAAYYRAIQKKSISQIDSDQFKKMEENALKNYFVADSYQRLAESFGNSTEKVWAVVYGEVYCNLATESETAESMGNLVFGWYDKSLSKKPNGLSISLTENAQGSIGQVPFESRFEQLFLMSSFGVGGDVTPLSIEKITAIRKNQLSLWNQQKMPMNELMKWQASIIAAGHFDAYNYWLFRAARPDEVKDWLKNHSVQFQSWLDWREKNNFSPRSPDFQRLYLLKKR